MENPQMLPAKQDIQTTPTPAPIQSPSSRSVKFIFLAVGILLLFGIGILLIVMHEKKTESNISLLHTTPVVSPTLVYLNPAGQKPTTASTLQSYKTVGLSFSYPSDWRVVNSTDSAGVTDIEYKTPQTHPIVSVKRNVNPILLDTLNDLSQQGKITKKTVSTDTYPVYLYAGNIAQGDAIHPHHEIFAIVQGLNTYTAVSIFYPDSQNDPLTESVLNEVLQSLSIN